MDPTVLEVEDDPDDALFVQEAFAAASCPARVRLVRDGEEAVAYLKGSGAFKDRRRFPLPALVLLDLKLPRMGGLEFLHWRASQAGLKRIPVIILSASAEPGDVLKAFDLGANAYLVKPVSSAKLATLIARLCDFWLRASALPPAP